jgi:hypothetical protein
MRIASHQKGLRLFPTPEEYAELSKAPLYASIDPRSVHKFVMLSHQPLAGGHPAIFSPVGRHEEQKQLILSRKSMGKDWPDNLPQFTMTETIMADAGTGDAWYVERPATVKDKPKPKPKLPAKVDTSDIPEVGEEWFSKATGLMQAVNVVNLYKQRLGPKLQLMVVGEKLHVQLHMGD